MDNKALSEGISFTSKRKWDKDSEKVEENTQKLNVFGGFKKEIKS